MSADASSNRIVRWEILNGLPGEGPTPKHFHLGHPTPWTEGLVVKFWAEDGSSWVGNFQSGGFGHTEVIPWPEADSVAVIATDNFYLVDVGNPDLYYTLGPQDLVTSALFDEDRTTLFIAERYGVIAYGTDRKTKWVAQGFGGVIVELKSWIGGVLTLEIEEEMGEPLLTARLSAKDGTFLGSKVEN